MALNVHAGKLADTFDFDRSLRKPLLRLDKSLLSPTASFYINNFSEAAN